MVLPIMKLVLLYAKIHSVKVKCGFAKLRWLVRKKMGDRRSRKGVHETKEFGGKKGKEFERYKVLKNSLGIEDPKGELATART